MRLLHTSDWHLGRSFHGVDLVGAQAAMVDGLVDVVRSEKVDAVLSRATSMTGRCRRSRRSSCGARPSSG